MSPRTQAPVPLDDRSYWRRLKAAAHPDRNGGDHDLFVFVSALEEHVRECLAGEGESKRPEPDPQPKRPPDGKPRVPYPAGTDFEECTRTALRYASLGKPYGHLLSLLADCQPLENLSHEQNRGASYKRLAAIVHLWQMTKMERVGWYRVAEDLPLSDRHASHILGKLKKRAA